MSRDEDRWGRHVALVEALSNPQASPLPNPAQEDPMSQPPRHDELRQAANADLDHPPAEVYEAAALAVVGKLQPTNHGSGCPVWAGRNNGTEPADCTCWVLRDARDYVRAAVDVVWSLARTEERTHG